MPAPALVKHEEFDSFAAPQEMRGIRVKTALLRTENYDLLAVQYCRGSRTEQWLNEYDHHVANRGISILTGQGLLTSQRVAFAKAFKIYGGVATAVKKQYMQSDPDAAGFTASHCLCRACKKSVKIMKGKVRVCMDLRGWLDHKLTCEPLQTLLRQGFKQNTRPVQDDPTPQDRSLDRPIVPTFTPSQLTNLSQFVSKRPSQVHKHASVVDVGREKLVGLNTKLAGDRCVGKIEQYRVWCTPCRKWIKLKGSSVYHWKRHKTRKGHVELAKGHINTRHLGKIQSKLLNTSDLASSLMVKRDAKHASAPMLSAPSLKRKRDDHTPENSSEEYGGGTSLGIGRRQLEMNAFRLKSSEISAGPPSERENEGWGAYLLSTAGNVLGLW